MIHAAVFTLLCFPLFVGPSDQKLEDHIREAVFRYMFEHEATQQMAKSFFIGFGPVGEGEDPGDEFLKRFKNHKPVVKKLSQSTFSKDGMVIDKETGAPGIRFSAREVTWVSDNEALVEAGYFVAGLFAGGCEYRVVLENEKWIVAGCAGKHWVS